MGKYFKETKWEKDLKQYAIVLVIMFAVMLFVPQYAFCAQIETETTEITGKISFYQLKAPEDFLNSFVSFIVDEKSSSTPEYTVDKIILKSSIHNNILGITHIPDTGFSQNSITFRTFASKVEVYSGALKIYDYNGKSFGVGKALGYGYHIIHLPDSFKNDVLMFRLDSAFTQTGSLISDLRVGSENGITAYVSNKIITTVREEIYFIILGCLFIFIGIILITFFYCKKDREYAFNYLGISSVFIGVWVLCENNIITVLTEHKYITFVLASIAIQLMPIGFLGFVDEIFSENKSKLNKILRRILLCMAIVTFILDVTRMLSFLTTIRIFHLVLVLAIAVILTTVLKSAVKGGIEAKIYLVAFSLLSLFGIIDILNMFYLHLSFMKNLYISPWAMFIFVLLLMVILYIRIQNMNKQLLESTKHIESQNQQLQKAWEEVKETRDTIADWSINLEKKVHQRTEQLESANEELTAINEELTETMDALKRAQLQLVQSEKMASLGNLVAGVAHEINTPLATIKSNIQLENMLLEALIPEDRESVGLFKESVAPMAEINMDALERIIDIVKNLRNFARLDEAEFKEANIHDGIESTLALVRNQLSNKVDLIKNYGTLPLLKCYPKQLNQVFLNLLVNAIHAVEDAGRRGRIEIKTEYKNNMVNISFEDNGTGISEKNVDKIFDPGFTTKGVGIGTGLGLSISYNIIEKHNGKIKVESREGIGTRFIIELPAAV